MSYVVIRGIYEAVKRANAPTSGKKKTVEKIEDYTESRSLGVEDLLNAGNTSNKIISNILMNSGKKNEKIAEIFRKIEEAYKDCKEASKQINEKKLLEYAYACEPQIIETKEIIEELESMGFKFNYDNSREFFYTLPNNKMERGYEWRTFTPVATINGVALTREDLESGKNPYREQLNKYIESHSSLLSDIKALSDRYDKLSKQKIRLALSETKRDELKEVEKELGKLQAMFDKLEEYARYTQIFDDLTPQQKKKFVEYFDSYNRLAELSDKVTKERIEHGLKDGYVGYAYEEEYKKFIKETTKKAIKTLSKEELAELSKLFKSLADQFVSGKKQVKNYEGSQVSNPQMHIVLEYLAEPFRKELTQAYVSYQKDKKISPVGI